LIPRTSCRRASRHRVFDLVEDTGGKGELRGSGTLDQHVLVGPSLGATV